MYIYVGGESVEHMTRKASGAAEAMELLLQPLREVVQALIDAGVGSQVPSSSSSSKPRKKSTEARKPEDHGRREKGGGGAVSGKGGARSRQSWRRWLLGHRTRRQLATRR